VKIDNRFNQGETEAAAGRASGRISAIKAVEDAWQMVGRDSRSIIADGDLDAGFKIANRNANPSIVRRKTKRVVDQISDRAIE
jgi:hypothetical protein